MKKLLCFIVRSLVFWFLVFAVCRLFFLLYQLPIGNKIKDDADTWKAFYKAYPLDLSTASMFILLPLSFAIVHWISGKKIFRKIAIVLSALFLVCYVSIALGDAGLYREWNAKLNMQALEHFRHPGEVLKTVSTKLILLYIVLMGIFCIPLYILYKKWVFPATVQVQEGKLIRRVLQGILFFLVSVALGVIAIRGGLFNIPINQSIAYFSNDVLANDIAVNPFYNLLQDIDIKSKLNSSKMYKFRSNEEARALIASDYLLAKDSSVSILNMERPNLLFIFLEGWSADNIASLGGIEGCTPRFDSLCNESLLFTHAYSDAYVSDQGIPAVLSAYPSAHRMAIVNQPTKVHNLPCISEQLIPLGYTCSFLFGGELVYGNLRGYLLEKKFSELIEVYDLEQYPKGKLGVHDEFTFRELPGIIQRKTYPFLQCFFTSSTHMPYDFTPSDRWSSDRSDPEKQYTESMHYADIHLGRFFDSVRHMTWYDSTLVIVVADHSHNSIKQWDVASSMRQHIPILFTGGALKEEWRGKRWDPVVSQLDIAATLLTQMNLDTKLYPWSRNMLNPYKPSSAFYVFYGGAGYVNDTGFASCFYNNIDYIINNLEDSTLKIPYRDKALSFQQLVLENVRYRK